MSAVRRIDLSCPDTDGYAEDCRATVRILAQPGKRLLATGRLSSSGDPEDPARFPRLHLTTLGHRLAGDHRRQWATTVIRGPLVARTAWTISF
jgi:hypothetical protein